MTTVSSVTQKDGGGVAKDEGCVMEAVTPERFELLRGSADVADGYRRMIRFIIAGNTTKGFLARCQATKKNLDEQLALLLEPDRTPTSPNEAFPRRGKHVHGRDHLMSAMA